MLMLIENWEKMSLASWRYLQKAKPFLQLSNEGVRTNT